MAAIVKRGSLPTFVAPDGTVTSVVAMNTDSTTLWGGPSIATMSPPTNVNLKATVCGEALSPFDACFIHSDKKAYKSYGNLANPNASGTTAAKSSRVHGYAGSQTYRVGDPVSLQSDISVGYAAGTLTPGAAVYLSDSVGGGLDTVAGTNNATPLGFAEDDSVVWLKKSF